MTELQLHSKTIFVPVELEILCLIVPVNSNRAVLVDPPTKQIQIEIESDSIQIG